MEERLKQLKDGLDGYLAVENKFTESQKVKIRNAIAKKRKNRSRFLQADWVKQGLSIAVACSLLISIGTFAYYNIAGNGNDSSMDKAFSLSGSENKQEAATDRNAVIAEAPESKDKSAKSTVQQADRIETTSPKIEIEGKAIPVNESILPLSEEMLALYSEFKQHPDQELLRGLEPYQVMQLYYYASMQRDYDTQYEFYIKDEEIWVPTKEEFLNDVNNDPISEKNTEKHMERIQTVTSMTQYMQENSNSKDLDRAIMEYKFNNPESYEYFQLIKSKDGIWTVSWTPIQ